MLFSENTRRRCSAMGILLVMAFSNVGYAQQPQQDEKVGDNDDTSVNEAQETGLENGDDIQQEDVSQDSTSQDSSEDQSVDPNNQPVQVEAVPREPTFNVWEFIIDGIYLVDTYAVQKTLTPFLGPDKTFSDVEKATEALEKLYSDSGYPAVIVDIPEQDVADGRVKISVIEGKVSRIRVTDSDYFLLSDIKSKIPSLKVGDPLYTPQLQEELNYVNSLSSDLRVVPVLKAGKNPGDMEVELKVKDKRPFHGRFELNDNSPADTTATRFVGQVGYDNLWHKYHSFSIQLQTSPENTEEVKVFSGTYVVPAEKGASRVAFYAVKSDSLVEATSVSETVEGSSVTNNLRVAGDSSIGGVRYVKPMNYSSGFQHVLNLGFDFKDVLENVTLTSSSEDEADGELLEIEPQPVSFAIWSAQYTATWRKPKSLTRFGVSAHFGIDGLFNELEEFEDKRFRAEPNFFYLKSSFRRMDRLPAGFRISSELGLQYTEKPLLSNEQLSIGGVSTVRGYWQSQQLGDRGILGTLEFESPNLIYSKKSKSDLRLLFFYDAGAVETLRPLPGQDDGASLSGSGIGLRFAAWGFDLDFDWSQALQDSCETICGEDPGDVESGDTRTNVKLTFKF